MPDIHLAAMQDGQAMISAENLTVRFGGLPAIENVNISIGVGEIVTLIGPNGAGKSTLVRALLGLVAPTDGTITRRVDVRIGYVPQQVSVDDTLPLSVERFLRLGGRASQDQLEKALAEARWTSSRHHFKKSQAANVAACCWPAPCCAIQTYWY